MIFLKGSCFVEDNLTLFLWSCLISHFEKLSFHFLCLHCDFDLLKLYPIVLCKLKKFDVLKEIFAELLSTLEYIYLFVVIFLSILCTCLLFLS